MLGLSAKYCHEAVPRGACVVAATRGLEQQTEDLVKARRKQMTMELRHAGEPGWGECPINKAMEIIETCKSTCTTFGCEAFVVVLLRVLLLFAALVCL